MGKRTRRRTRQTDAPAPTTRGASQHMARVNVDAATWRAFRMEAVRTGTSAAGYLGALVIAEVDRLDRRREPGHPFHDAGDA
jgi:hypothetical protein